MKRYDYSNVFEFVVFDHTAGFQGFIRSYKDEDGVKVLLINHEYGAKCPERGENTYWVYREDVPAEIFKYSDKFDWVNGNINLWIDEQRVTKENYRTAVYVQLDPDAIPYTEQRIRQVYDEDTGEFIDEIYDFTVEPEMVFDHYTYLDWQLMTDIAPIIEQEII